MKRRSEGASPNGGFLYFRPVEFLEQSLLFFSGAKIECGAFTNRNRDGTPWLQRRYTCIAVSAVGLKHS
jgi:hypothetical protein